MIRPSGSEGRRSLRERAFINASSNILGTVVTLAVWFGVTPVILHRFSVAEYGLWVLGTAIASYAPLLDLGIGDAITRYVASHRARGESLEASRMIAAGFRIYVVLGVLTLAVTAVLAPFFAGLFHLPGAERSLALPVVALAGLAAAVAFPGITYLAILRGIQRFDLVNVVSTSSSIVMGIVVVVVLQAGGNVVALAAIGAPMELLAQIPMVLFIRRAAPELMLRPSLANRNTTKALLSFGIAQSIVRGARQVRWYSDEIIIGAIRSVQTVSPYAVVHRLTAPAMQLSDQLLDTLLPLAAHLHTHDDRVRMRELLLTGTRAALGAFLLAGVSIALLAEPFIRFWAGHKYLTHAGIAPLLVAAGMLQAGMAPAENLLAGMRKLRVPVAASAAAAVAKLAFAVGLGLAFGIVGVAAAGVVAGLVNTGPIVVRALRAVQLPLGRLALHALVPAGLATASAAGGVVVSRALVGDGSLIAVLFDGAVGCVAFIGVYLLAPAASLEREVVGRAFSAISGRHRADHEAQRSGGVA